MPILFLLLYTCLLVPVAGAQQAIFKTYTVQDGLVANQVRRVIQDSKGFIWIATWEGVSRYDGNKFINFHSGNGLSFELINDIYEGPDGKLYIAENNGKIEYIRHNRVGKLSDENLVVNRFIKKSDTSVYAITDNKGILVFREGQLRPASESPMKSVQDMAVMNDSLTLVLNAHNEPVILGKDLKPYSKTGNFAAIALAKDTRNNTWICSYEGLRLLDPVQKRNEPIRYLPLPSLMSHPIIRKNRHIHHLFEDADHNYWLSSMNGLIRVSPNGNTQLFTTKNGLPTNLVINLYQDKEKNIWMCSELGLVKGVMKNDAQFITMENGLATNMVNTLVAAKDSRYYLNNFNRLFILHEQGFLLKPIGPVAYFENMIPDPDGKNLLVISNQGLWRIQDSTGSMQKLLDPIPGYGLFSIVVDRFGNFFLGTNRGIVMYRNGSTTVIPSFNYRITTLVMDRQGFIWAGTWQHGLYRIKVTYSADTPGFRVENHSSLVPDLHIRSSFEDRDGAIWIGTRYHGAFRLLPHEEKPEKQKSVDKRQGLSSNWVSTFAQDQKGNIWIGTHSGLNKLIDGPNGYRVFDFGKLNNYFGEVKCITPAPGNIIWCGTNSGLIRFRDDELDTLPPPPLYLTSMRVGDSTHHAPENLESRLSIPYGSNQVSFEFSAPGFINEKTILYSYRLVGSPDTAWSVPGNQHSVSYASLQPGTYTFEVRAHRWNEEPGKTTRLSFIINPPFWQTGWFYLLLGLVIILLLYGIYRYRVNQWMKWQKVRNHIATDLHDDIGSSLTNISVLAELSKKSLGQPAQGLKYLDRISEEVNASGQALDDIIWSVNSRHDSLDEMIIRMRRFAAELFDDTSTNCQLRLQPAAAGKKIGMEQRKDLYLAFKESLNNIYKHAAATRVMVELSIMDHSVILSIADNGKGFDTRQVTDRNGLKNLRSRIQKWKGHIAIQSSPGKGTMIEIVVPVAH